MVRPFRKVALFDSRRSVRPLLMYGLYRGAAYGLGPCRALGSWPRGGQRGVVVTLLDELIASGCVC